MNNAIEKPMTVEEKLEIALGALADIALSEDMTEQVRRAKAKRIYEELSGKKVTD